MTIEEFCERHPRLFHMATADSLEQIRKHGLISTSSILDLLGITGEQRERLTDQRRPEMTYLNHPVHGNFTLRDQKPMRDAALAVCLDGMSIPEWYRSLNSRVFMWASRERVDALLAARAYRKTDQLVLTIKSQPLIQKYFDQITVSTINSGATLYTPVRRGIQTFVPLKDFDGGKGSKQIVEVTVTPSIPDMTDYIVLAEVRKAQR